MGFVSERRIHPRYPRRIEVRFWRQGEAQPHSGFTTNISRTGIFLGTGYLLAPGERVRVEIVDPEKGFIAEGRVVRAHRVAQALRHVDQAGVGIRFLQPEELIEELLPAAGRSVAAPLRAGTAVSVSEAETGESGPAAVAAPELAASPAAAASSRVVPVDFPDRSAFLSVYHRDLASGGLFVSTASPAALQEIVTIELRTPLPDQAPLRFEARVVHRFEPDAAVGSGRNLLSGMGLQFLEPERVKAALAPILAELRK
jgi:Tfp pilus assembly protein PilZ